RCGNSGWDRVRRFGCGRRLSVRNARHRAGLQHHDPAPARYPGRLRTDRPARPPPPRRPRTSAFAAVRPVGQAVPDITRPATTQSTAVQLAPNAGYVRRSLTYWFAALITNLLRLTSN